MGQLSGSGWLNVKLVHVDVQHAGDSTVGIAVKDDDYLTVTMLSVGLAQILQRRSRAAEGGRNEEGLLPAAWRVGFSRVWWRCQDQAAPSLESDLELLALCNQPFVTWPVLLDLSDADMQNSLLAGEELSAFAEEGSRLARHDVEGEWVENRVHRALRDAAAANGSTDEEVDEAYATLRRFMIDNTVVADREVHRLERRFPAVDTTQQTFVLRLINTAYVARSVVGPQSFLKCPGCGNVVSDVYVSCGTPGCAGGSAVTLLVQPLAVVFEQHRATRRFIHDPGLVECRIIDELTVPELAGLVRVTAYPGVDTLDVLIEFLQPAEDGRPRAIEAWGVDAKDQLSARMLGRNFTWPDRIECQRRYLALPTHRASVPGYVDDLEIELDGRVAGVRVIDEKKLIAQVKAYAKELAR